MRNRLYAFLSIVLTCAFGYWYLNRPQRPSEAELQSVWRNIAEVGNLTGPCVAKGSTQLECLCKNRVAVRSLLRAANAILERYPKIENETIQGGPKGAEYRIEVQSLRTAENFRCP